MPGLTALIDPRLKIIRANAAFLTAFDKRGTEVTGQDLLKFLDIGELEEEQVREYLSTNMSSTQPLRFEAFIRTGPENRNVHHHRYTFLSLSG